MFADVIAAMTGRQNVAVGTGRRGFGTDALTVEGRIFAMVSHDRLVLKLPSSRVAELIAAGAGLAFDAGKGRPMKEWVVVAGRLADSNQQIRALADEALRFVAAGPSGRAASSRSSFGIRDTGR